MSSDKTVTGFFFERTYECVIPEREDGLDLEKRNSLIAGKAYYTDGSLMRGSSGIGVFTDSPNEELSLPTGNFASIFQCEIYAIIKAAQLIESNCAITSATICSDSQAAIRAILSHKSNSKLVRECQILLDKLAKKIQIKLIWVPGHNDIPGNEKADSLAKAGAESVAMGPEPILGCAPDKPVAEIASWLNSTSRRTWLATASRRQTKQLLVGFSESNTKRLISWNKQWIRIFIGTVTGHFHFNKHLNNIGARDDPDCDYCGKEDTGLHFLCNCPFYQVARLKAFGALLVEPESIKGSFPSKIWDFIRTSRRFSELTRWTG